MNDDVARFSGVLSVVGPVVSDFTEAELVGRIRERLPSGPEWLVVGIGDDAAVVEPERNRLEVLTVDAIVEGVHFDRRFTPPEAIGHRALAVNLSDVAAMGATPRAALLSLALPPALTIADFDGIIIGLARLAMSSRTTVAGGNLTRTPGPLTIDVMVTGSVKRRHVLTRGGARPGDELYLTGTIGAASAGLQMLQHGLYSASGAGAASSSRVPAGCTTPSVSGRQRCMRRYLYPEPRLRLGALLGRNRAASACMDLSDGLADAVHQVAGASGVGAVIDAARLPIDPDARPWFEECGADAVQQAVAGGDDYELLIAARPRTRGRLAAAERYGDVPLTRVGYCTAERPVLLREGGTDRPLPRGYHHFR